MDVMLYNKIDSKLVPVTETWYLHPLLILADTVSYCSPWSEFMMLYRSVEEFNESMTISVYKQILYQRKDEEMASQMTEFEAFIPTVKKIRKKKHKTKQELVLMMDFKKMLRAFKDDIRDFHSEMLSGVGLLQMEPFIADEIWNVDFKELSSNNSHEDDFIAKISTGIIEREYLLLFDFYVEKIFSHTLLDEVHDENYDFIKIPLWDMPPFADITYEQMKYTREQLQPHLEPLKEQLIGLSDLLTDVVYDRDNLSRITQLCMDEIHPYIGNVKNNIDESLYLCKMKNMFPEGLAMKFCLGITSNDNMVNYYEKLGIIEPYMANEIKQRISRNIDLHTSNIFCYFELLNKNKSSNFNE
jgi:hypothetical protein